MKKQEEKENLQTAIMHRLDLLGFDELDIKKSYVVLQFIIDYIYTYVSDKKYFENGNYNLTIGKGIIEIEFEELDGFEITIRIDKNDLVHNSIILSNNRFPHPVCRSIISEIDDSILYRRVDFSRREEYTYSTNDEYSYKFKIAGDENPKFYAKAVDLNTHVNNKAYYELTIMPTKPLEDKNKKEKTIKKTICIYRQTNLLDFPENIMDVYDKLKEERDKQFNKNDKKGRLLKKIINK